MWLIVYALMVLDFSSDLRGQRIDLKEISLKRKTRQMITLINSKSQLLEIGEKFGIFSKLTLDST